jgi:hypothetical protein
LKAFGALCIGSVIAFKWQHWRDFMMQFKIVVEIIQGQFWLLDWD